MRKALIVDCCLRREESRTRELMDAFVSALPEDVSPEVLVLEEEGLSCLTGAFFEQRQKLLDENALNHPRFRYAHQLAEADLVAIAAPFWDLSFPALLKVYIENCSVDGITFTSRHGGLAGLCKGTDLVFLTTRGGVFTDDPMEMGSRYLDALHTFFGFDRYHCIAADGMDMSAFDHAKVLEEAKQKAIQLAKSL